nr:reverse transcriptase domain-containing protein [Tanacetum cinerariifolium]
MEEEENRAIQSINETSAQKAAKRRKLNEEVEDLKRNQLDKLKSREIKGLCMIKQRDKDLRNKDLTDDDDQEDEWGDGEDDEEDEGGDDEQASDEQEFIHPSLSTHTKEEARDEEIFDPILKTPEDTNDEGSGEENLGLNVSREEGYNEEEEEDKLYRDVNINQGRGIQTTQEVEDSHVTLTSVYPDALLVAFSLGALADSGSFPSLHLLDPWSGPAEDSSSLSASSSRRLFNVTEDPPLEVPMADNRTMAELLQAPTEGYEDAIVISEIAANNFELKHGLINLVQNKQWKFLGQNAPRMLENNREQVQSLSIMSQGSRRQDKKNQSSASTSSPTPAPVKAVEPNCVTCG